MWKEILFFLSILMRAANFKSAITSQTNRDRTAHNFARLISEHNWKLHFHGEIFCIKSANTYKFTCSMGLPSGDAMRCSLLRHTQTPSAIWMSSARPPMEHFCRRRWKWILYCRFFEWPNEHVNETPNDRARYKLHCQCTEIFSIFYYYFRSPGIM